MNDRELARLKQGDWVVDPNGIEYCVELVDRCNRTVHIDLGTDACGVPGVLLIAAEVLTVLP